MANVQEFRQSVQSNQEQILAQIIGDEFKEEPEISNHHESAAYVNLNEVDACSEHAENETDSSSSNEDEKDNDDKDENYSPSVKRNQLRRRSQGGAVPPGIKHSPERHKRGGTKTEDRTLDNVIFSTTAKTTNKDEVIKSFMKITCDLCEIKDEYDDVPRLFKHFSTVHNVKGYVRCCQLRMSKRCAIYEHVVWHKNPAAFTCDICQKTFPRSTSLHTHQKIHLPDELKVFKCPQCPQKFPAVYRLNAHIEWKHTPMEEREPCPQCHKKFMSRHHLRAHIKSVHDRLRPYICEVCAKCYPSRNALKVHQNSDHAGSRVRCGHCGVLYKNVYILKKHLHRVNDSLKDHFCDECDHKAKNQLSLREHKKNMHNKKAIVHTCNICAKTFKKSLTLQVRASRYRVLCLCRARIYQYICNIFINFRNT